MNKDEVDYSLKGRCGVYLLEINGVKYVGSSVNLYRRINDHKNHLKRRVHKNRHMQNAWNKYKELKWRVLEFSSECEVRKLEQFYMDKYNVFNTGFNQSKNSVSPKGYKHTEESRRIMSLKKIGIKQSKEHIEKRVGKLRGIKRTEEFKRNLSEMRKGDKNPRYGVKECPIKKKKRMKNMLSKERWNKGLAKDNNEIIRRMSEKLKGRVAPNKTPHKLIDLKTGEVYKSDSLSELSKIAPIFLSSIVRIKNGTIGKKLKGKYKLEW